MAVETEDQPVAETETVGPEETVVVGDDRESAILAELTEKMDKKFAVEEAPDTEESDTEATETVEEDKPVAAIPESTIELARAVGMDEDDANSFKDEESLLRYLSKRAGQLIREESTKQPEPKEKEEPPAPTKLFNNPFSHEDDPETAKIYDKIQEELAASIESRLKPLRDENAALKKQVSEHEKSMAGQRAATFQQSFDKWRESEKDETMKGLISDPKNQKDLIRFTADMVKVRIDRNEKPSKDDVTRMFDQAKWALFGDKYAEAVRQKVSGDIKARNGTPMHRPTKRAFVDNEEELKSRDPKVREKAVLARTSARMKEKGMRVDPWMS